MDVDNHFVYKDENGEIKAEAFGPISQKDLSDIGPFDPSTGESVFLGITLFPGENGATNSTDDNVKIIINSNLSDQGRAENYAHEGYGHSYFFSIGKPHSHEPAMEYDPDSKGYFFRETNKALGEQISDRVKETTKNFKAGKNSVRRRKFRRRK